MFKLKVIAGPLRGNSYEMRDGENTVGRVNGNDVVLNSAKVSKKHCLLVVNGGAVTVRDAGSSNGTFVNGVLTTVKKVSAGDRISVGEHVLELTKSVTTAVAPSGGGKVVPFQKPNAPGAVAAAYGTGLPGIAGIPGLPPLGAPAAAAPGAGTPNAPAPPQDYIEKVKFYFEKYVINFLYTQNEKHEWNVIVKALLAILVVFTAGVAVFPVVQKTQDVLLVESKNRARALARLMVDHNTPALLKRSESDLDIGFAEREAGVIAAYIVDMDLRVMAPGKKLNQILTDGQQGRFADNARKHFEKKERYFSMPYWNDDGSLNETYVPLDGGMLGVAEPVKVIDPAKNQNVVVAMAIVFLDITGFLMDDGTIFMIFATSVVFAAIMGLAVYASIHRLTTRPINTLNQEVDKVLRGESHSVTLTAKMEELDPLVQIVNTALQRATPSGGASQPTAENPEDFLALAKFSAERSTSPMIVFTADLKLHYINPPAEEVTGIRLDGNQGNDLTAACRDEASALMLKDLLGRAPTGGSDGVSDSLEFSGVNYQLEAVGLGAPMGAAKGYIVTMRQA